MESVNPQSLLQVIQAEKINKGGNFTLRSKSSNRDYTYRVSRSSYNNRWYTHVYVETQYLKFIHLGTYQSGQIMKNRLPVQTPSAAGIAWLFRQLETGNFGKIASQAEVMHTGCCLRCGRELTDAESIRIGLGPTCRSIR